MNNPFINNTKTVTFAGVGDKFLSVRFTKVDDRVYAVIADLWPHLTPAFNEDMAGCIELIHRAAVAFCGDNEFHVVGDGTYDCLIVDESEGAYLSRQATTLLALTSSPKNDGALASGFTEDDVQDMFDKAQAAFQV